jgi:hypothetical protein
MLILDEILFILALKIEIKCEAFCKINFYKFVKAYGNCLGDLTLRLAMSIIRG